MWSPRLSVRSLRGTITSTLFAEVGCYGRSDASNTTATHNFAAASPTSRGSAAASVPTYLGYIHGG